MQIQDEHVGDQGGELPGDGRQPRGHQLPRTELHAPGPLTNRQDTWIVGLQHLGEDALAPVMNRTSTPVPDVEVQPDTAVKTPLPHRPAEPAQDLAHPARQHLYLAARHVDIPDPNPDPFPFELGRGAQLVAALPLVVTAQVDVVVADHPTEPTTPARGPDQEHQDRGAQESHRQWAAWCNTAWPTSSATRAVTAPTPIMNRSAPGVKL